jgi:ATP-binding protein involved in chromosome partitioning
MVAIEILADIKNIEFNNGYKLGDVISEIIIKENGDVGFAIDISNVSIEDGERVKKIAEKKLSSWPKIGKINIIFTKEKMAQQKIDERKNIISHGKTIIIASGKGGVGKSTVSLALAKKLEFLGKSVGLVDLDIHGPSIAIMAGIDKNIEVENGLMIPVQHDNIKIMSIGFLIKDLDAVAWRGPMISKTLNQFLFATLWGKLDYLIIDTPPGTGDVHITLLEKYQIDKILIVTNPDRLSVADVKKTISLYKKFDINFAGIIENNSFFISPETGTKFNLFGEGGGKELSSIFSVPLLDQIPTINNFDINKDFQKIISDKVIKAIQEN